MNDAPDGQVDLSDDYFIQMSESAAGILCWQPLTEPGSLAAAEFSQPSSGFWWRQQVVSLRGLIARYAEPWIVAA